MSILLMAAACDEAPTGPEAPAALVSSAARRSIQGAAPQDCPPGWTWHWDGHCTANSGGGSGGGTGGGGGGGDQTGGGGGGGGAPGSGGPGAPAGFEQAEWDALTNAERMLVLNEWPKWYNRRHEMRAIADFAKSESRRLSNAPDRDGTRQNAFQHVLWSARMAITYGYHDALKWTNAHEDRPRPLNVSEELWNQHKSMDLKNNELGLSWSWRPFGSESEWAEQSQAQMCWIEGEGARSCL